MKPVITIPQDMWQPIKDALRSVGLGTNVKVMQHYYDKMNNDLDGITIRNIDHRNYKDAYLVKDAREKEMRRLSLGAKGFVNNDGLDETIGRYKL